MTLMELLPWSIILTQIWRFFQHESSTLIVDASANTSPPSLHLIFLLASNQNTILLLCVFGIFFLISHAILESQCKGILCTLSISKWEAFPSHDVGKCIVFVSWLREMCLKMHLDIFKLFPRNFVRLVLIHSTHTKTSYHWRLFLHHYICSQMHNKPINNNNTFILSMTWLNFKAKIF